MSVAKRAIKNSFIIFVFSILALASGYLTRIFLAKNLSPTNFGLFYAVWTFFMSLYLLKDFGLNSALIKFLPSYYLDKKKDVKTFVSTIFWTKISLSLLFSIIILSLSSFLASKYFKNNLAKIFIMFFIFYFILSVFEEIISSANTGFQQPGLASVLYFFSKTFFLLLTIIFFYFGFGVMSPVFGITITPILIFVIGILFLRKTKFGISLRFNKKILAKSLRFGLPLTMAAVGGFLIGYFDVLMLTHYTNLEVVGIYSAVLATAMIFGYFGSAVSSVIFPTVSEAVEKKNYSLVNKSIEITYKYALTIIMPAVIISFLFPKTILTILFSKLFVSASIAFQILLIGTIFLNVSLINISYLSGLGLSKEVGKVYLLASITNVIGNLILIPLLGINGAAIMTSVSYFLMFLYSIYALYNVKSINLNFVFLGRLIASSSIFTAVLIFLKNIFLVESIFLSAVIVIISGIVYLIFSLYSNLISIKEIKELIGIS